MAFGSGRRAGEDEANASGIELEGGSFIGEGDVEDGIRTWASAEGWARASILAVVS
jgi:hypothetical protein